MVKEKNSIINTILNILGEKSYTPNESLNYTGIRTNIFYLPQFKNVSRNAFDVTLSRMRKSGFINIDTEKGWYLTREGKAYAKKKYDSLKQFQNPFTEKTVARNLLVMFDISENRKGEREWFRWHLKKFKYIMIQKSAWVGPSPLPKEFIDYVKEIGLKDSIKTFKLAKPYPAKS